MGEIIKILSKGKLRGDQFSIELNKPHSRDKENSVHIQTSKFRWEVPESDFLSIAISTLSAIQKIKRNKKLK